MDSTKPTDADRTIVVYVGLGSGDNILERVISFERPSGIPVPELLAHGMVIDGRSACIMVGPVWEGLVHQSAVIGFGHAPDGSFSCSTLLHALLKAEVSLVEFLAGYGYSLEFESAT